MPCVILCGGKSTRMGQLKQNLQIDATTQETLANFQAKRFSQWFSKVYFSAKFEIQNSLGIATILDSFVSAKGDFQQINPFIHAQDLQSIPEKYFAPLFGLQSILKFLQCNVFVVSVDTPFLDYDSVALLLEFFARNPKPTFAKNSEIHPLLGVYTLESLVDIQAQMMQGDYKLMRLLKKINAQFVEIKEDKTQNLNTVQDYQKALPQIQSLIKV